MTESILTRMMREHAQTFSGSSIYRPAPEQPKPRDLYRDSPVYSGLQAYSREVADPLAQRPGESAENWERRTAVHRRAADLAAQADAEQQAWSEHRNVVDGRQGARGIFGNDEAAARQAAQAAHAVRANSMGQNIAQQGHLAASVLQTSGQPSLSMLSRLPRKDGPVIPQRTDVTSLRSTGTGILGAGQ